MVKACAIWACPSTSEKGTRRSFFVFPKCEERCRMWVQATGRPELMDKTVDFLSKQCFICDLHFKPEDRFSRKLHCNAVPTLNLKSPENDNPTESIQIDMIIQKEDTSQTDTSVPNAVYIPQTQYADFPLKIKDEIVGEPELVPDIFIEEKPYLQTELPSILITSNATLTSQTLLENSPLKRNLASTVEKECKKPRIVQTEQQITSVFQGAWKALPESQSKPQSEQQSESQNTQNLNAHGNRYDKESKVSALKLYLTYPLAYRALAKTLNLPSERTLRRININAGTNLNSNVLKFLEMKLRNMKDIDKYCVICADEMSLKPNLHYQINEDRIEGFHEIDEIQTTEPATQAVVLLARGIFSRWKQPLGFSLLAQNQSHDALYMWLHDVISKLINIGYCVVAFTSNQNSIFMNLANEWRVSIEQPYFFIDEKKIYYVYDAPQLLMSLRNFLMKHDFEFLDSDGTELTATWEDVETLYKCDCQRNFRLVPKLTKSHINPNKSEKMDYTYATQVFSYTVASAMNCLIELGQLKQSSMGTVKLIELINNTFDILNSCVTNNASKYKIAFAGEQHQIEALEQFEQFCSSVVVNTTLKKNDKVRECLNGLQITVNSIKSLSNDLQSEGYHNLFTRRLNLDIMKNFFDLIKQHSGNCREPTSMLFKIAFKKLFMVYIFKHSEHPNCNILLTQLLNKNDSNDSDQGTFENFDASEISEYEESTNLTISVGTIDYRFDLPKEKAFEYVCGYLLKKCFDNHKCKDINNFIVPFLKCKTLNQDKMYQMYPPDTFISCIKAMDDRLKLYFQKHNKQNWK